MVRIGRCSPIAAAKSCLISTWIVGRFGGYIVDERGLVTRYEEDDRANCVVEVGFSRARPLRISVKFLSQRCHYHVAISSLPSLRLLLPSTPRRRRRHRQHEDEIRQPSMLCTEAECATSSMAHESQRSIAPTTALKAPGAYESLALYIKS